MTRSKTTSGELAPPGDTLAMLACLREAVAEALERKRLLGQYWAEWTPEDPRLSGPDAPQLPVIAGDRPRHDQNRTRGAS
jgi:hypothetical protein